MDDNYSHDDMYDPSHATMENMMPSYCNDDIDGIYRNVEYMTDDTVYKGVSMRGPTMIEYYPSCDIYSADHQDQYVPYNQKVDAIPTKLHIETVDPLEYNTNPLSIPMPPIVILNTSFNCSKEPTDIISSIVEVFNTIGVSFEFSPSGCEFNAVFVKGALYTKFQVHVYDNSLISGGTSNGHDYTVECQRLCGDGFAFNSIFGELRNTVLTGELTSAMYNGAASVPLSPRPDSVSIPYLSSSLSSSCLSSMASSSMSSSSLSSSPPEDALMQPLTEEEKILFLEPIKKMTSNDATMESQLEGCRLLCDMITSNHNFHEQLLSAGFVETLIRLSLNSSHLTCQHAVISLLELSATPSCMDAIWTALVENHHEQCFITFLCGQVVDGPYYTETTRRQCAQLLSNMLDFLHSSNCATDNAYSSLIQVVDDKLVSPRALRKTCGEPSLKCKSVFELNVSPSSPVLSRQSSLNVGSSVRIADTLQDEFIEECVQKISSVLQQGRDSSKLL